MAIGFRSSTSGDVATAPATLTVSLPAGVTASDVVILVICSGASGAAPPTYPTPPAGWTAVGSLADQANGSDHVSQWVYRALGNVANLGFAKGANAGTVGWVTLAFTGVDNVTPVDATGTPNSTTTNVTTLTTNAVTVATAGAWHLIGFGDWFGGPFTASGFTVVMNAAANESAALLYNTTPKSAGSTGTVVVTSGASATGEVLIGVPFALRPAATSGPVAKLFVRSQAVRRAAFF